MRDYFAAKAMQSIILMKAEEMREIYETRCISDAAYIQADSMLAEREKKQ